MIHFERREEAARVEADVVDLGEVRRRADDRNQLGGRPAIRESLRIASPGPSPSCQPTIIADGAPALIAFASSSVMFGRRSTSMKLLPLAKLLMLIFAT